MKNFLRLVTPFFNGDDKLYARWAGLGLLLLSQATTMFGYFFIQWNRRFYDALEAKDSTLFFRESIIFVILSISIVLASSLTRYYGQQYALRWRMWMTRSSLTSWLRHQKRDNIEGSDQRIQEDLMRFTAIFERFFLDCVNSIILIIALTPLLFTHAAELQLFNFNLAWVLLITVVTYTLLGMLISAKIGNPLIQYEYDSQKLEAEFRYKLVHARDGANTSVGLFNDLLVNLAANYQKIYSRHKFFNVWQKSYDQFSYLIPFALLASSYFAGLLTLGMLMQIKSIFSRIRNSMAYLLDHYTEFTEMMAISKRLVEFDAITVVNTPNHPIVNEPSLINPV